MNIRRFIDKNNKLIWKIVLIIVFTLFIIKTLNAFYEKQEEIKFEEMSKIENNSESKKPIRIVHSTKSDSVENTMESFINYCNKKEIEKAYQILTQECKNAMFPTVEYFETIYINNIFNIERTYEMVKWSTEGNKNTYLVTLYGDLLATGGKTNSTQEYYTFVQDEEGIYKLNINNYIYGEDRNLSTTINGITVHVGNVDIYEEYEETQITITNNTSKKIYIKKIYLQDSKNVKYSSLNSEIDTEEIVMNPNSSQSFFVEFNKVYSSINKAQYLVLGDIILDYEEYLNSEDKANYYNKINIKAKYK